MNGWAKNITVSPGKRATKPSKSFKSKKFFTTEGWEKDADENFDYGAIILDESIGDSYGYFSLGTYSDEKLRDRLVNISGYPASEYGDVQMHQANRVKTVTTRKIYYDIDTEGGQSGSPAWVYEDENNDRPVVIGIHAYGAGLASAFNSGVRVTKELIDVVDGWRTK